MNEYKMRKKIRIGIDLDDTIWNFNEVALNYLNNKFNKNYTLNDCVHYYVFNDFYGLSREDMPIILKEIESSDFDYRLFDNVKKVLNEWKEFYEIIFITARPDIVCNETTLKLFSYLGFRAPVYFCSDKNGNKMKSKKEYCKELDISIMIDDGLHNLEECANNGIKCLLLDFPWNRNVELHKNIIRVKNWNEIRSFVIDYTLDEKMNSLLLSDSVYGNEVIDEDVLIDLINCNSIQRLRGISQFGFPQKYYYRKVFSRYDHSIGTLILLRRLGAGLIEQIAGLLHDVSHTAFSHVVDWVVGDPSNQSYQDGIYCEFIKNSEIPGILSRYGIDFNEVLNLENFNLLERDSPDLCADRLDYSLREMKMYGVDVDRILLNLAVKNNEIIFEDLETSILFSVEYLKLNKVHWAGEKSKMMFTLFANVLKRSFDEGIIEFEDLELKNDFEVIGILLNSRKKFILDLFELFENEFDVVLDEGGIVLEKKFRYIDPKVFVNNEVNRLSFLSEKYKGDLDNEKKDSLIVGKYSIKKRNDKNE